MAVTRVKNWFAFEKSRVMNTFAFSRCNENRIFPSPRIIPVEI